MLGQRKDRNYCSECSFFKARSSGLWRRVDLW